MSNTVLVTGSSRGIGKAIALYLASNGYDIVVHCRSRRAEADQVATEIREIGQAARVLQFDLSNRQQCAEQLLEDVEQNEAYYAVVCNAGITADNAFPVGRRPRYRVAEGNLRREVQFQGLRPVVGRTGCSDPRGQTR